MKRNLFAGLAVLVALGAVAAFGGWYFLIRSDAPPSVSIESARQSVGSQGGAGLDGQDLAGEWTLVPGENSFAGYRVGENLAGVGTVTAVGRTQGLNGSLDFDGDTITSVEVTADLTTLKSDKDMRDRALGSQAIETNTYKTAVFALTSPIEIDDVNEGETVVQKVKGNLTLHGVTKPIEMDVQGVLEGEQLVVIGSTDIKFADFSIAQPRSQAVLSIDDHGIMEFQLVFAKA